ncbi:MAG: serine/threonine protein kinase [Proteobacteria bacterium]|nr:serine/threonine protein kinase [Pseudomonadota bacterium]MCP4922247.1 serine/threonine protein kinase [Pseudomonadota bacterium]
MTRFHPAELPCDFGRYRLTGLLGEGGMAWVFDAHLIGPFGFRKPVAVKVVKADVAGVPAKQVILNEARLASRVMHPNVVDILDVGEVDGTTFFVMERVSGVSVKRLLQEGAPAAPAALDLLQQVASGLAAIHDIRDADGRSAAVVHRDLKPENVLVDTNGGARLVDFGIAVGADQAEPDQIWGTPRYMSPEQAWGDVVTAASDVFGFGVLAYEIVFGEKLLPGGSVSKVRRALMQLEDRLDAVAVAADARGEGFGAVLRGCLREEPAARFQNGLELFAALDRVRVEGRSDLAERVSALAGSTPEPEPAHTTTNLVPKEQSWVERYADEPVRLIRGDGGAIAENAVALHRTSGGVAIVVSLRERAGVDALRVIARALGVTAGVSGRASIAEVLAARRPLIVLEHADAAEHELRRWLTAWKVVDSGARLLVTGMDLDLPGARVLEVGDGSGRAARRWARLSRQARRVVGACALFSDGFTLDDAVEVLQGAGFDEPWRYLARLGDDGFLRQDGERLLVEGAYVAHGAAALNEGQRRRVLTAHARHFASWGEDALFDARIGPRALERQARWIADLGNLEAAVARVESPRERAALVRVLLEVRTLGYEVAGLDAARMRVGGASPGWRLRVDVSLARWLNHIGDVSALNTARSAVTQAERLQEPALLADAWTQVASAQLHRVDYRDARRAAERAAEIAERAELRHVLLRAVRLQAVLRRREGDSRTALNLLSWCAALCRATGDQHFGTRVDGLVGLCRMSLGELDEAEVALERAVSRLREMTDVVGRINQLGNLALLQTRQGRLRDAVRHLHEAVGDAERHAVGGTSNLHRSLAAIAFDLGDLDASLRHARQAVALAEAHTERYQLGFGHLVQCLVHRAAGRMPESRLAERAARDAASASGERDLTATLDVIAADRTLAEGDIAAARAAAERLLPLPAFQSRNHMRGELLSLHAEVLVQLGRGDEALEAVDEALEILAPFDHTNWQRARGRRCLALLRLGRLDDAGRELAELQAFIDRERLGPNAVVRRLAERGKRQLARARRARR